MPCSTLGIQPLSCSTHHIQPLLHRMQEETYAQNFVPPIYTLAVPPCCITCVLNLRRDCLLHCSSGHRLALYPLATLTHMLSRGALYLLISLLPLRWTSSLASASLRSLPAFSHACMRRVKGCRRGFGGGVSGASRRHYSVA